ncbi:MAG: DnaJ domain-containing protein [Fimbriimonadaceae bacterium]
MKTLANHYGVLGVARSADPETLRKAYRRLARQHHPDVSSDPRSHDLMTRINEAFETLMDPGRRDEYDALLSRGVLDEPEMPRYEGKRKPVLVRLAQRLKMHRTPIYGLAFTPGEGLLVSTAFNNEIIWADPITAGLHRKARVDGSPISAIRNLTDDRLVAAGVAESQLSMWRLEAGDVRSWRTALTHWLSCLNISPDGQVIVGGGVDHQVSAWDTVTGKQMFSHDDHSASVTALAWSHDGKFLATGSADSSVKLRDGATGKVLHSFLGVRSAVTALDFSPNGQYIAAASVDYSVRVLRVGDGMLQKVMFGHTKPIETLDFHPNGWLFASGARDGQVRLWNAAEGLGQLEIEASPLAISKVAFSPDGKLLAAAGLDKTVRLWSLDVKEG